MLVLGNKIEFDFRASKKKTKQIQDRQTNRQRDEQADGHFIGPFKGNVEMLLILEKKKHGIENMDCKSRSLWTTM